MHALEAQDALHAPVVDVHPQAKGKAGYCAMRGNCGRATMFGAELPCPDDGKADQVSGKGVGNRRECPCSRGVGVGLAPR